MVVAKTGCKRGKFGPEFAEAMGVKGALSWLKFNGGGAASTTVCGCRGYSELHYDRFLVSFNYFGVQIVAI